MSTPGERIEFQHLIPGYVTLRDEELSLLVKNAVEAGASAALAKIGLGDEKAATDLREMRDWLSAWRMAKKTAWHTVVSTVVRAMLVLFFLAVLFKLGLKVPSGAL